MVDKIVGDPGAFVGVSEHSHQVALFAALAQYAYWYEQKANEKQLLMMNMSAGDMDVMQATDLWAEEGKARRMSEVLKWIHAVPNGGTRGNDKRSAMIAGANMKAEGVKTGVSDIDVPYAAHGYHGFKIEMKAPGKLNGESKEQKEYGAYLAQCGYLYGVFDNWANALMAIKWYLRIDCHPFEWSIPDTFNRLI